MFDEKQLKKSLLSDLLKPLFTRLDSPRVDHLVSQLNPTHLLASQKNSNPTRLTTGWWVKRVGSWVDLIKKIQIFKFFFSQN